MENSKFIDHTPVGKSVGIGAFDKTLPIKIETENFKLEGVLTNIIKKGNAANNSSPIQELNGLKNTGSITNILRTLIHDLNNQLSAIMGNLDLALDSYKMNPDLYEILTETRTSAFDSTETAGKIHSALRGLNAKTESLDINNIIMDIVRNATRSYSTIIQYSFDEKISPVQGYRLQIMQALSDIIKYCARAAGEKGRLKVIVSQCLVDENSHLPIENGKYIEISIGEVGGYSSEFCSRINPGDDSLLFAREIIKEHGGFMTVILEGKTNASLNIYFKPEDSARYCKNLNGSETKKNARILFMDDRGEVRKVVYNILAKLGYEPECVEDGFQAIEKYKDALNSGKPYNAVILDLNVPGGLGAKETIVELQKIDPNVRALVCSGYHNSAIMTNHEKFGFCGFVAKPFTLDEFSRVIHDAIIKSNTQIKHTISKQTVS